MTTVASVTSDVTAFCVCTNCGDELVAGDGHLTCTACETQYAIINGIPIMLLAYDDDLHRRYVAAYDEIARDDLDKPLEYDRDVRHQVLLDFIGDTSGDRILDVGSSNAKYLRRLPGAEKVAVDIAFRYLESIPSDTGIIGICADVEILPVKPGYFDTIIVSDVVEHLLEPQRLVDRLMRLCRADTRVIVHVPWKEDLSKYAESEYEFTHLRTFNEYSFAEMWRYFRIRRERATYPRLEEPIMFPLKRFLPLRVYNRLVGSYFQGDLATREYEMRARWIRELPRREWWLLRIYEPAFRMFELRLRPEYVEANADGGKSRRLSRPWSRRRG